MSPPRVTPARAVTETSVFAPVRSQTAFEETLERIGTAIRLGLLVPGARLPAERELCARLGISRSTLRQALTALVQSGHLVAVRGRNGGTFVAEQPPLARPPSAELLAGWHAACDQRLVVEVGVAVLAAERAREDDLAELEALVSSMDSLYADFPSYRHTDVRFHIGLAETTGTPELVASMTAVQAAMTDLIAHIAHPPEVLARSNAQHGRLITALRRRDAAKSVAIVTEHLRGTEHVLGGLLPQPRA